MAKSRVKARAEKDAAIDGLVERLSRAEIAVLTEYRGLSVSELQDLRGRLRPSGVEYVIAKNTLGDGSAFDVAIHDYRSRSGQVFYAAARQPSIPAALRGDVSELGTLLGYQLMHRAQPPNIPRDVPRGGLRPPALLRTYNAEPLARDGFTGKGLGTMFVLLIVPPPAAI